MAVYDPYGDADEGFRLAAPLLERMATPETAVVWSQVCRGFRACMLNRFPAAWWTAGRGVGQSVERVRLARALGCPWTDQEIVREAAGLGAIDVLEHVMPLLERAARVKVERYQYHPSVVDSLMADHYHYDVALRAGLREQWAVVRWVHGYGQTIPCLVLAAALVAGEVPAGLSRYDRPVHLADVLPTVPAVDLDAWLADPANRDAAGQCQLDQLSYKCLVTVDCPWIRQTVTATGSSDEICLSRTYDVATDIRPAGPGYQIVVVLGHVPLDPAGLVVPLATLPFASPRVTLAPGSRATEWGVVYSGYHVRERKLLTPAVMLDGERLYELGNYRGTLSERLADARLEVFGE